MTYHSTVHTASTVTAALLFGVVLADVAVRLAESKYARMFGRRSMRPGRDLGGQWRLRD